MKRPKIIVAPLDWGLGHATRCIPIIYALLEAGCEVLIAAEGFQKNLLAGEFPGLRIIHLPGYRLRYGRNGWLTRIKIIIQIPKILIQINRENQWLNRVLDTERPDAIISDNRYGLSAPAVKSVFLTHQLKIKTPFGNLFQKSLLRWNCHFIRRFSYCWIPDASGGQSLAGALSHPGTLPVSNTRYIGLLSRFRSCAESAIAYDLIILLSGPEPQRTIFENLLLKELSGTRLRVALVRGLPGSASKPAPAGDVFVHNHLPAAILNKFICESALVLCRSGYSSIMDMMRLGKKCILVPTPGQTEQEYLANYLFSKRFAFTAKQENFKLGACLDAAAGFPFVKYEEEKKNHLQEAVSELLNALPVPKEPGLTTPPNHKSLG